MLDEPFNVCIDLVNLTVKLAMDKGSVDHIMCTFCEDQHTTLTLARHNGHLRLSKLLEKYSHRGEGTLYRAHPVSVLTFCANR